MDLTSFKQRVQALFPERFENTMMYGDDPVTIDNLIRQAYELAISKFEKIEEGYFSASQDAPRMASILKWNVSTEGQREYPSVWDTMGPVVKPQYRIKCYLTPSGRLIIEPGFVTVYIEYTVNTDLLTIEDLSPQYIQWAIKYANALLKEKEGYLGTAAKLEGLQIETNYEAMRGEAQTDMATLDEQLDNMYAGTLAIRHN